MKFKNSSKRVNSIKESITLKLNQDAQRLKDKGTQTYNLTAGQLPFKPDLSFINSIKNQLNFLQSYQYSPTEGFGQLHKNLFSYLKIKYNFDFKKFSNEGEFNYSLFVSSGAKQALFNFIGVTIEQGDEVIILAPYWLSYPAMVKIWGGKPVVISRDMFDSYIPDLNEVEKAITSKTKLIIINSPNNPTGIYYPKKWMQRFADLMIDNPNIKCLSDEIYRDLYYFDPKPTYHYEIKPELFHRTMIVNGISKSFACTGLRMGFGLAEESIVKNVLKLQSHSASGSNSLIQRALINYDFENVKDFLLDVNNHLRRNANILQEVFRDSKLAKCWYQINSAYYFLIDFSYTNIFKVLKKKHKNEEDLSSLICSKLLDDKGVILVPGSDFGAPNCARISIILEHESFKEAMIKLTEFLNEKELN
jgi:aspartate aminotransferase